VYATPSLIDNPADYLPAGTSYARVIERTETYASREDVHQENPSERHGHPDANVYVTVLERDVIDGEPYYRVSWNWGEPVRWIAKSALSFDLPLSRLRGIELARYQDKHLAMTYVDSAPVLTAPVGMGEAELVATLERYHYMTVERETHVSPVVLSEVDLSKKQLDPTWQLIGTWYKIGPEQWLHSAYVRNLIPSDRPEPVAEDERWIEISLDEQSLIAHEGDTPVFGTLTSTGRRGRETVTGLFRPWYQLRWSPLRGRSFGLAYDLAAVPYVVYFEEAYAWHGTYWHDRFGTRQSAGCVNLSPFDAEWLFEWAEPPHPPGELALRPDDDNPGTWVYVH